MQRIQTCKKNTTFLSEKSSKDMTSNTKESSNEVDMKGVRSDPIQDKTNSEEMKIHHTESRDYINTKA